MTAINVGDKSFVMMVGPTGCGKTTFREKNLPALACVCPDSFIIGPWTPEKVKLAWGYAETMAEILFKEGKSFIFDAQFVNENARRRWQETARSKGFTPVGFIFDTPWEQIQENQKNRGSRGTYGAVPMTVQETAFKAFEAQKQSKTLFEGFDTYIVAEWGKELSYFGT